MFNNYNSYNVVNGVPNTSGVDPNGVYPSLPLDVKTTVNSVAKQVKFTGLDNHFCYADFPVTYDPCTCFNPSALYASFTGISTSDIQLQGTFMGTDASLSSIDDGTFNPSSTYSNLCPSCSSSANGSISLGVNGYVSGVGATASGSVMATYPSFNDFMTGVKNNYASQTGGGADFITAGLSWLSGASLGVGINYITPNQDNIGEVGGPAGVAGILALSLVSSFLSAGISAGEEAPPSIIQGVLQASGTSTSTNPVVETYCYFTNPGSQYLQTNPQIPYQEFYNGTYQMPNYPKYNEALGLFALLQTPTILHYNNYNLNTISWDKPAMIVDQWKLNSPIQYIFNSAAHPDLQNTAIGAALVIINTGATVGNSGVADYFPHELTLASKNGSNSVYVTPLVPLDQLSTLVPVLEVFDGGNPGNYEVYVKLIVNFVSTDMYYSAPGVKTTAPNQSALIFTYPVNIVNTSTNLAGFTSQANLEKPFWVYTVPETTLTLPATHYVLNSGTPLHQQPNQYAYAWNEIDITGNLTADAGVQVTIDSYDGPITIEQGVTIGQGMNLQTGPTTLYKPVPGTGNYTGSLQSWCTGGSNPQLTNAYAANQLAIPNNALRLSADAAAVPASPQEIGASLSVYPNPFANSTTIKYSIPAAGDVELAVYDIMGNKVKDLQNGFQSSGDYTLSFQSGSLEDGVYLLRINSEEYTNTEKIVIVR